jgi:hypothetical protein
MFNGLHYVITPSIFPFRTTKDCFVILIPRKDSEDLFIVSDTFRKLILTTKYSNITIITN